MGFMEISTKWNFVQGSPFLIPPPNVTRVNLFPLVRVPKHFFFFSSSRIFLPSIIYTYSLSEPAIIIGLEGVRVSGERETERDSTIPHTTS